MTEKKPGERGFEGFSSYYWKENYSDLKMMDGVINAKEHARYVKSIMGLETIDVNSIIDFGCGLGYLFKEFLNAFRPYRAMALEPSHYAYTKLLGKKLTSIESINIKLHHIDLAGWAKEIAPLHKKFDLGICTSVFQYLSDDEIELILPLMSKNVSYLYFSVPTDLELKRQRVELGFHDRFAFSRSKGHYRKMIKEHFTIVSSRLLESKYFTSEGEGPFSDLLFRY